MADLSNDEDDENEKKDSGKNDAAKQKALYDDLELFLR